MVTRLARLLTAMLKMCNLGNALLHEELLVKFDTFSKPFSEQVLFQETIKVLSRFLLQSDDVQSTQKLMYILIKLLKHVRLISGIKCSN